MIYNLLAQKYFDWMGRLCFGTPTPNGPQLSPTVQLSV